jgi:hypothetical protein
MFINWTLGVLLPVHCCYLIALEIVLNQKKYALIKKINGRGDSLRWPRDTLYPLKLALT